MASRVDWTVLCGPALGFNSTEVAAIIVACASHVLPVRYPLNQSTLWKFMRGDNRGQPEGEKL